MKARRKSNIEGTHKKQKAIRSGVHPSIRKAVVARTRADAQSKITGRGSIQRDITARKRAEAALRESEALYRQLIRGVPVTIYTTDEQGFLTLWNEAAEELWGRIPKAGQDRWCGSWKLYTADGDFLPHEECPMAVAITERRVIRGVQAIGEKPDGTRFSFLANASPLYDVTGAFKGAMNVMMDITEHKQTEEKLQRQNQRLAALRDIDIAILAADSFDNIVRAALDHVCELIDCHRASLSLFNWGTNEAVFFDVRTVNETSIPKGMHVPLALFQDMIQTFSKNEPVLINDLNALADPPPQIQSIIRDGLRSLCNLPLFSQGNLIGAFSLSSEIPGFFDEESINLGREVANQVAIAITQSNLLQALRELNAELEGRVAERTAKLSQANVLLQAMMDNTPDHIFFKDIHSRFIRNSRSQANFLGLTDPAEVVGKSDFDFFSHAQRAFDEEQEVIRSGQPLVDVEEYVVSPDQHVMWVSTTKVPLLDQEGQVIGIFGIARDITARKQAEEAERKAKVELQAANKELEAFSYSVSHDLRAPLRGIEGFSQALTCKYSDAVGEEGQHYLTRIRENTRCMGQLIDDLLSLARITRREMKRENVNLSKIAREIAAELGAQEPGRRVDFVIEAQVEARGDTGLLKIVLHNLLGNAFKFTSTRAPAKIQFGMLPSSTPAASHGSGMAEGQSKGDEGTVFFVRDNGVGFDMAYANKLFGAFQRLHAMDEFPGTGIGLATVQRIIHRHGGKIWVEAEVEQGAAFYFMLRGKP